MERSEWLKLVRAQTESLYDHLAYKYWVEFGFYAHETHQQFLKKFLARLDQDSYVLSAACGAGRDDGTLVEAGHRVLGIDQSALMLARARQHYPEEQYPRLQYAKIGLHEMDFHAEFDGAICIDALENLFPEDWSEVVASFQRALKPGGVLYVTVEIAEPEDISQAYESARAQGLPVVYGEMADGIQAAYEKLEALGWKDFPNNLAAEAVYHYYPSREQVRAWFEAAGLQIEVEGTGDGYAHYLARRL